MKTAEQIVADCNALARKLYASLGYEAPEGYRFDKALHPQELGMWNMAVIAYEHIEGTEVDDALNELESGDV